MSDPVVAQVAYDTRERPYRGFAVKASYLAAPHDQDALIEYFRDGELWKSFRYPAYRIYNIAAHFTDNVDEHLECESPTT